MALLRPAHILLLILSTVVCSTTAKKNANGTGSKPSISIGRFHIPISDDWFNQSGILYNQTLKTHLDKLMDNSADYWNDEYNVTTTDQASHLELLAKQALLADETQVIEPLNQTTYAALETYQSLFQAYPDIYDYALWYVDSVYNLTAWTQFYTLASFTGVGRTVGCSSYINQVLADLQPWEAAGSNAAINVMLLLPTFLAFGNLFVPRSSEAFSTSLLVGVSSAVFSLGLPVKSISAIAERNHIRVRDFTLSVRKTIASFSLLDPNAAFKAHRGSRRLSVYRTPPTLSELQSWTDPRSEPEAKQHFAQIRAAVEDWRERSHWWHLPAVFVASCQIIMFGLAVAPLLTTLGAPRFIFSCYSNWTGWYLGVSASVNAVLRLLMWESGYHERLKIYALSRSARRDLEVLIKRTSPSMEDAVKNPKSNLTTANQLPPLYPPYLERGMYYWDSSLVWLQRLITRSVHRGKSRKSDHLSNKGDDESSIGDTVGPRKADLVHSLKTTSRSSKSKWRGRLYYFAHNPFNFLTSGFFSTSDLDLSARRWRPLIVLVHLEPEGRAKLFTLFTGFIEALLLLILTFFFAAQWGGNLYVTGIALLLLLIFITAGRALGVVYVMLSSKVWGLHVVHCDDHDDLRGCLRILCSMTGVLVQVNGASYFGGYKLDGRQTSTYIAEPKKDTRAPKHTTPDDDDNDDGEKGIQCFDDWRKKYEKGDYDEAEEEDDDDDDDEEEDADGWRAQMGAEPGYEMTTKSAANRNSDTDATTTTTDDEHGSHHLPPMRTVSFSSLTASIEQAAHPQQQQQQRQNHPSSLSSLETTDPGAAPAPGAHVTGVPPSPATAQKRPTFAHRDTATANSTAALLPEQRVRQ